MKKLLNWILDHSFTVGVLILATTAFQSLLFDPSNPEAGIQGSPVLRAVWAAVYVITAVRAFQNRAEIINVIRANRFLFLLVLLTVVSAAWSQAPGLTLRRSLAVVATTLFAVDFAVRYPLHKQLRMIGAALYVIVLLSVAIQVFMPHSIPSIESPYSDAWNGAFIQKNMFGKIAALTAVVILARARSTWSSLFFVSMAVVAAFGLIAKTQSMGAFIVLAAMLVLVPVCRVIRWKLLRGAVAAQFLKALVVLPAVFLLLPNLGALFTLIGRDSTLTGRAQLWTMSLQAAAKSPILGYGYNAFWNVSQQAMQIRSMLHWNPPHSHNSFIDLTLQLGLVGLFLFVAAYAVAIRRAVSYTRPSLGRESMWPLAYLSFTLLFGITEGGFVAPGSIFWMLFVAAACSVTQLPVLAVVPAPEQAEAEASSGTMQPGGLILGPDWA
jgi:exopolysaccharide production protein ExoQ